MELFNQVRSQLPRRNRHLVQVAVGLAVVALAGVLAQPATAAISLKVNVATGDLKIVGQPGDTLASYVIYSTSNTSSLDSALYLNSVAPGVYSAMVAGNNNGTGVALAEVYDLTASASFTATTPR